MNGLLLLCFVILMFVSYLSQDHLRLPVYFSYAFTISAMYMV